MPTAYTPQLGLSLPTQGELSGTWGDVTNTSMTSLVDSAIAGTTTISADADVTLTATTGVANQARAAILVLNSVRSTTRYITAPATSKIYTVINATSGGFPVVIRGVGPTVGVAVPAGKTLIVAWNGADFVSVGVEGSSFSGILPVVNGGTGASTAPAALTALGAAPINSPTFTGSPQAPTPSVFSNDTTIATTALVNAKILGGVTGSASVIRETQTATAGQTVFNLVNSYTPGSSALWVYINGVRQFPGTFTETSATVVTFSDGLFVGDVVLFEVGLITSGTSVAASAVSLSAVSGLSGVTSVQDAILQLAMPPIVVSGTTQGAVRNTHYILVNGAATTVTLPGTPAAGDAVWVTWTNGLTTNVVARNGQTIANDPTNLTLDTGVRGTVQLRFVDNSWEVM